MALSKKLLWRGLFVRAFPYSMGLGWFHPAIGFALWHFAPLRVMPNRNPGGPWTVGNESSSWLDAD